MNSPNLHREQYQAEDTPPDGFDGYLEYSARTAIRDLIRRDGFEGAREKIAFYLIDEADRRQN
jgi:hypothetical protein